VNAADVNNIEAYQLQFNAFLARAKSEGAFSGSYWEADQSYNFCEFFGPRLSLGLGS
jgi:hypothetical protein